QRPRATRSRLGVPLKALPNALKPHGQQARALVPALHQIAEGSPLHRPRMRYVVAHKKHRAVDVARIGKRRTVQAVERGRQGLTMEVGRLRVEVPFEDASWVQPVDA